MNCKESLKEYIDKDEIYQDYKQDKLMNCSDFDKFCIQHCKDIEELLEENLELEQALDEIEKICNSISREDSICDIEKIHDIEIILQKAKFYGKEVVGEIGFNSGCFLLWNSCVSDNQLFIFTDIEVIGNVWENEID